MRPLIFPNIQRMKHRSWQRVYIPESDAAEVEADLVIVGGGPAGLTAGISAAGDVEGGYKPIVIAAAKGAEAALTIFEDLINPYWKKQG